MVVKHEKAAERSATLQANLAKQNQAVTDGRNPLEKILRWINS